MEIKTNNHWETYMQSLKDSGQISDFSYKKDGNNVCYTIQLLPSRFERLTYNKGFYIIKPKVPRKLKKKLKRNPASS